MRKVRDARIQNSRYGKQTRLVFLTQKKKKKESE